MSEKTNAARILDRLKIKYELVEYTVDPDNLAADHVAEELGEHIEQVYKTLVLRGDKTGIIVCVVAGTGRSTSRRQQRHPAIRKWR